MADGSWIQQKIDAAVQEKRGTIDIPAGVWEIKHPIVIPPITEHWAQIHIRGAGPPSVIQANYANDPIIHFVKADDLRMVMSKVSDVHLVRKPNYAHNGIGLYLEEQPWCRVDRVQFTNLETGLVVSSGGDTIVSNCVFVQVKIGNYHGFYPPGQDSDVFMTIKNGIRFETGSSNNVVENCRFTVTDTAMSFKDTSLKMRGCICFGEHEYTCVFHGDGTIDIQQCHFEGATQDTISFPNHCAESTIMGNGFWGVGNQQSGLRFGDGCSNMRIIGNTFRGNHGSRINAVRPDHFVISNNTFSHHSGSPYIILDGCEHAVINGNIFEADSTCEACIYLSRHISGRASIGIAISGNNFADADCPPIMANAIHSGEDPCVIASGNVMHRNHQNIGSLP